LQAWFISRWYRHEKSDHRHRLLRAGSGHAAAAPRDERAAAYACSRACPMKLVENAYIRHVCSMAIAVF
jgi:hypothetical protein